MARKTTFLAAADSAAAPAAGPEPSAPPAEPVPEPADGDRGDGEDAPAVAWKTVQSSIVVRIEEHGRNIIGDAIMDTLTNLPEARNILLHHGVFYFNNADPIKISEGVYAVMTDTSTGIMGYLDEADHRAIQAAADADLDAAPRLPADQKVGVPNPTEKDMHRYIEVFSYTLTMDKLRLAIDDMLRQFRLKLHNKLGRDLYYFSEVSLHADPGGVRNMSSSHYTDPHLMFNMQKFVTNRSFSNLFGEEFHQIRRRAEFFMANRQWYDNKGVPYTLGLMLTGSPGTGKTSVAKCLANEMQRHIVNVQLNDNMTKTQMENLFYNEMLTVSTSNGKSELLAIPIEKRLYVFEDIDAQSSIVHTRDYDESDPIQRLQREKLDLRTQLNEANARIAALESVSSGGMPMPGMRNPLTPIHVNGPTSGQKVTLSLLLNILDGILETPGRVVIMSSNFVERLDKALIRPGRIDLIARFSFATNPQIREMLEHRYDRRLTTKQAQIVGRLQPCLTPAEVGRVLFENFNSLDGALQALTEASNLAAAKKRSPQTNPSLPVAITVDNESTDEAECTETIATTVATDYAEFKHSR